jgi:hypothetical protein
MGLFIDDQPERLNPETRYPDGTLWQDDSSLGEDGLVDMYVRNGDWELLRRAVPLSFFSPTRCDSLNSVETQRGESEESLPPCKT